MKDFHDNAGANFKRDGYEAYRRYRTKAQNRELAVLRQFFIENPSEEIDAFDPERQTHNPTKERCSMSDFCNFTTITKTRKPYRCAWCGEPIERGTSCVVASGVTDGDPFRACLHHECRAAHAEMWRKGLGDDAYWDGTLARGRTDDDRESPPEFDVSGRRTDVLQQQAWRVFRAERAAARTAPDPSVGTPTT